MLPIAQTTRLLVATPTARMRAPGRPLCLARGFGEKPIPPKPDNSGKTGKKREAKSLMPLADAASKLLPKQGADGKEQFNNPAVGDFQVLDSLVEVSRCIAADSRVEKETITSIATMMISKW